MDDTGEDDREGDAPRQLAAARSRSGEWAIVAAVVLLLACWAMLVL